MENSFADKVTFILNDLVAMLSLPELCDGKDFDNMVVTKTMNYLSELCVHFN